MEIRQLEYFLAAARTGSARAAARACSVKQPSLTQGIARLEEEIGTDLFERSSTGLALTEAGRAFLTRAESIVGAIKTARRSVDENLEMGRVWISLGAIPTVAPFVVPRALAEMRSALPEVRVELCEDTTDRLLDRLLSYDIDLAVLATPVNDARLRQTDLVTEPLFIVMHPEHACAAKPALDRADLEDEGIIVLHEIHCLGRQIGSFCDRAGLRKFIHCEVGSMQTLVSMVGAGLGLTLIPAMAAPLCDAHALAYRPLSGIEASRTISLVGRRSRVDSTASRELFSCLERAARSAVETATATPAS